MLLKFQTRLRLSPTPALPRPAMLQVACNAPRHRPRHRLSTVIVFFQESFVRGKFSVTGAASSSFKYKDSLKPSAHARKSLIRPAGPTPWQVYGSSESESRLNFNALHDSKFRAGAPAKLPGTAASTSERQLDLKSRSSLRQVVAKPGSKLNLNHEPDGHATVTGTSNESWSLAI